MKKSLVLVLACAAVLAIGPAASAGPITVSYTVAGWGPQSFPFNPGYPGDTLELLEYSSTVDLNPGVATNAKINTLMWTVNYSGGSGQPSDKDFTPVFNRMMTLEIGSDAVIQNGALLVRYYFDTLSWAAGSTVSFDFGSYVVDVTPLAGGPVTQDWLGKSSHDVRAEFVLRTVPDGGATLMLLGGALMGLGALRRKFRG